MASNSTLLSPINNVDICIITCNDISDNYNYHFTDKALNLGFSSEAP